MKNKNMILVAGAVVVMMLTSACGAQTNNSKADSAKFATNCFHTGFIRQP